MKQKIFISYARNDKEKVLRFTSLIDESRYETWIDEKGISYGDSYTSKIFDNLKHSDIFIVFLSENSVHSRWVKEEIDFAVREKIEHGRMEIFPVRLEKCMIPALISHMDFLDAVHSVEDALQSFRSRFGRISDAENPKYNIVIQYPPTIPETKYDESGRNQDYSLGIDMDEYGITVLVLKKEIMWSTEEYYWNCIEKGVVCTLRYDSEGYHFESPGGKASLVNAVRKDLQEYFGEGAVSAVLSVAMEMDQYTIHKIVKMFSDVNIYVIRVIDRLTAMTICNARCTGINGNVLSYKINRDSILTSVYYIECEFDERPSIFIEKGFSEYRTINSGDIDKTTEDVIKSCKALCSEVNLEWETMWILEERDERYSDTFRTKLKESGARVLSADVDHSAAIGAALYHEVMAFTEAVDFLLVDTYSARIDVKCGTERKTLVLPEYNIPSRKTVQLMLPVERDNVLLEITNHTIAGEEIPMSLIRLPAEIYDIAEAIEVTGEIDSRKNVLITVETANLVEES